MLKFLKIQEEHLALMLDWRTNPAVTRFMFTDIEHDLEAQKKWYQKAQQDHSSRYWVISYQDQLIGAAYLTEIDQHNRHCSWGYYIGESSSRMIGAIIPPYLYNYVFYEMKFRKLIAEVMEGNRNVMKMHEMFGYRLVGRYEKHICKYEQYHDLYVYELLAETWDAMPRYKRFIAEFE